MRKVKTFRDVARPRSDARPDFIYWEAIPRRGVPGRRPRNVKEVKTAHREYQSLHTGNQGSSVWIYASQWRTMDRELDVNTIELTDMFNHEYAFRSSRHARRSGGS
eukprot:2706306-Pyramimonas_sp.AAC.1